MAIISIPADEPQAALDQMQDGDTGIFTEERYVLKMPLYFRASGCSYVSSQTVHFEKSPNFEPNVAYAPDTCIVFTGSNNHWGVQAVILL